MIVNMELYCHIFILWILIWILCIQEHECCRFGPEPNCGFPCRCTGDNICDTDTGTCRGGSQCQSVLPDGYGWQGPGCRIGNVAYAKPRVEQSGVYLHYKAILAVDGDTTPYITNRKAESCAHPLKGTQSYAWWWVDLEDIFTIQSVTLVNRLSHPELFQPQDTFQAISTDFDIKIGNSSDRSTQTLCFHQDKSAAQVEPVETMTCGNEDMAGRYISFERTGGQNPNEAVICEFIVNGYKTIECHPTDCTGACDSVTGCEQCTAGKKLPDCQEDCPDGYWGVNCADTCGMCKGGVACDQVTGLCEEQCEGWYMPQLCTDELVLPPRIYDVKLSDITSDSATISWGRSNGFDPAIRQYFHFIVQYRRKEVTSDIWSTSGRIPLSDEHVLHYELSDLAYYAKYDVQIVPYREMNDLTEPGTIDTTEFLTLCKAPDSPPTPSIYGSLERFAVTWDDLKDVSPGCDRLESAVMIITCENSTHPILNETFNILIATNVFTYETTHAISCSVVLFITNNEGFSSASRKTFLSTATSTVIDSATGAAQQVDDNGPNITAIIVGTVLGVVVIILVVVIVVPVLRKHRNMPPQGGAKTDIDTAGKLNPVYENTNSDNDDIKPNINPTAEYASVEDTNRATAKVEGSTVTSGLYVNTKGPESQYASLDDSHTNTTIPSSVYQELK